MKHYTCKSKAVAVILCLCLGAFGVHRFYLGHPWLGVMWPVLTLLSFLLGAPLIVTALLVLDAIILLFRGKRYYRREIYTETAA